MRGEDWWEVLGDDQPILDKEAITVLPRLEKRKIQVYAIECFSWIKLDSVYCVTKIILWVT